MIDDDPPNVVSLIEGQVVGKDMPTEEEQKAWLLELVELNRTHPVKYYRRKKEVAELLNVPMGVIDAQVSSLKDALKADTGSAEDEVAQQVLDIGLTQSTLWHTPDRVTYASFERNGHVEHHAVDGQGFHDYLMVEYGKANQREVQGRLLPSYPIASTMKEAIGQLQSHARINGDEQRPRARLNYVDGVLWLDLGRDDWQGVRITEDDWKAEPRIEAPLIRGQGMRPLPVPVRGGNINELRQFTNTRTDEEFVLFCGCTAGLFNTFGNYTTTIFCGPAGSAKTTACRVMRRLVDPNKVDTKPFSTVRDLRHGAGSTHIVGLENISDIPDDFSDEICRLNTGLSF
jgi:hypothetical protein